MSWLMPHRYSAIGIDADGCFLNAVQLSKTSGQWRIASAVSLQCSTDDGSPERHDIERLRDVVDRQEFCGQRAILAAPRRSMITGLVEVPPEGSGAPVKEIARAELGRIHRRETTAFELACWRLPSQSRGAGGGQLMAVACPHSVADQMIQPYNDVGFEVTVVDSPACALLRSCGKQLDADGAVSALVEIGYSDVIVVIVYQGVIVYDRLIPDAGLRSLHADLRTQLEIEKEVADNLLSEVGLTASEVNAGQQGPLINRARRRIRSHFEAIVRDVNASFTYVAHQYQDSSSGRVYLAGCGSMIGGVDEFFQNSLNASVVRACSQEDFSGAPVICQRGDEAQFAMAVGLALWDVNP